MAGAEEPGDGVIGDIRDRAERKPLPRCVIREARHDERGFIFGHFLKSAHAAYAYRNMADVAFKAFGSRMLDALLERSQALVVAEKEAPDTLLGFAIAERPFRTLDDIVLHFVYVKDAYRSQGLCTALVKALGHDPAHTHLFATIMTVAWFHVGAKYGSIYNPFFLWPQFQTEKEKA